VTWAIKDKSYSQRRACALVGLQAKTYRYASRRSDDAPIRHRLLELAQQRRRFGYRRLHLLLRRESVMLNHKKLYRLYREERLMVRKRGGRKRAIGTRAPMALPQGPNRRWSLDFVSDALACGRKFRVLAVVDDFTRECLALIVDNSLSGIRVARELDRIVERRSRPCFVASDNGTDEHLFANRAEARRIIEAWRVDYNTVRPHSSLGGLTPTEFAARPGQGT